jgi:hypothetical protein
MNSFSAFIIFILMDEAAADLFRSQPNAEWSKEGRKGRRKRSDVTK